MLTVWLLFRYFIFLYSCNEPNDYVRGGLIRSFFASISCKTVEHFYSLLMKVPPTSIIFLREYCSSQFTWSRCVSLQTFGVLLCARMYRLAFNTLSHFNFGSLNTLLLEKAWNLLHPTHNQLTDLIFDSFDKFIFPCKLLI